MTLPLSSAVLEGIGIFLAEFFNGLDCPDPGVGFVLVAFPLADPIDVDKAYALSNLETVKIKQLLSQLIADGEIVAIQGIS